MQVTTAAGFTPFPLMLAILPSMLKITLMENHDRLPNTLTVNYLRSEARYHEELASLEADRMMLEAIMPLMARRRFIFFEPTVAQVVPLDEQCYLPPDRLQIEERWRLGLERDIRSTILLQEFGEDGLWLGPPSPDKPPVHGLTESEQRGFWVRFG